MPKQRPRRTTGPKGRPTPRATGRRPAPRPAPLPPATGLRGRVQKRTAVLLVYLASRPRWVLPVMTGLLLLLGIAVPAPAGLVALGLVLLLVSWLAYLSWPVADGRARVMRLVVLGLLVVLIVQQARVG